jgi:hypothetical protein
MGVSAEQILGVWLRAKVECPKDHTLINTGTWSNWTHHYIWATCPTCNLSALMHVKEIEPSPEQKRIIERENED